MNASDKASFELLEEVTTNMRSLYKEVYSGKMDLKMADSLANIAGKALKAEGQKLGREAFISGKPAPE